MLSLLLSSEKTREKNRDGAISLANVLREDEWKIPLMYRYWNNVTWNR